MPTPYEIAQRTGGAHHGMLLNLRRNFGLHQLRAGVANLTRRIEDHQRWIADPLSKPGLSAHTLQDIDRWVHQKWPADIRRLEEQRSIYEAVIREKEDGTIPSRS